MKYLWVSILLIVLGVQTLAVYFRRYFDDDLTIAAELGLDDNLGVVLDENLGCASRRNPRLLSLSVPALPLYLQMNSTEHNGTQKIASPPEARHNN